MGLVHAFSSVIDHSLRSASIGASRAARLAGYTPKITPIATDALLNNLGEGAVAAEAEPRDTRLTSREREILQLLSEGKSSKEVGSILEISTKTAETHRSNIMKKLELHNVAALVRYAVRNRIVEA